jgi:acyl-coenzyme A synthetase/AMP-(fatty) acid ligase
MTSVSALFDQLENGGDLPALFFPDSQSGPTSYRALNLATRYVAARITAAGLKKGDVVALELANEFLHAVLLVTCARLGIATISGRPQTIAGAIPIKGVIADKQHSGAARAYVSANPLIVVDESWLDAPGDPQDEPAFVAPQLDDLCRIMLTSGTTGQPKGVVLTYQMVAERVASYAWAFGPEFTDYRALLCGMRLSSSLGYGFLFYTLARGGFYCADSADFEKVVGSIKKFGLKALMTTPYTLAEILQYCAQNKKSFERLALILTAGSLASPGLARRVRGSLCDRLVIFYGTTETGVVATTSEDGEVGDVGLPVKGRRVEIVHPDGTSVTNGELGTIRISAASGSLPFYNLSDWERRTPVDWLCPGDVGSIDARGHLIIRGREDNIINVGGTKTTPEALEQVIVTAPGVRDCGVVCKRDEFGIDRIVAYLVLGQAWNSQAFQSYCEKNIMRDLLPTKFVLVNQIKRNQSNKIDREALANISG